MIKRLALLCCILLLPTIAAAASQAADVNHGEWWVGGQVGAIFTGNRNIDATLGPFNATIGNVRTDTGVMAGAIGGYNFCRPYKEVWQRYFGVAVDFQWNSFNQPQQTFQVFRGTSMPYPSWAGYNTRSGEMKGSPMAGLCPSPRLARPSSGQMLTSLMLAAATRPKPTLGSLPSLAVNFSCGHACPLRRPSVTVMSLGRTSRSPEC